MVAIGLRGTAMDMAKLDSGSLIFGRLDVGSLITGSLSFLIRPELPVISKQHLSRFKSSLFCPLLHLDRLAPISMCYMVADAKLSLSYVRRHRSITCGAGFRYTSYIELIENSLS